MEVGPWRYNLHGSSLEINIQGLRESNINSRIKIIGASQEGILQFRFGEWYAKLGLENPLPGSDPTMEAGPGQELRIL